MARTALIVKCNRRKRIAERRKAMGKKVKHSTKVYNRCRKCGKIGSYMRLFETCRICLKELIRDGKISGVRKSSW